MLDRCYLRHPARNRVCVFRPSFRAGRGINLRSIAIRARAFQVRRTRAVRGCERRARTVNKAPACTPEKETRLRDDGSYPSGHTAIGWAWALILSEIAPDQMDAILARGRAYGQSRVVCNVHWESDVIEGRTIGAAAVARLHNDSTFLADLAAAKVELAAVRAKGSVPARDCPSEAAELALDPPRAPLMMG
jgi:acid phosphatase (class A)